MMFPPISVFARISQKPHVRTSQNFCTCYLLLWIGLPHENGKLRQPIRVSESGLVNQRLKSTEHDATVPR